MSIVVGIASVAMVMYGGFKFISSSGDPAKSAAARKTITYAIAGLLTALFGQAIIIFVLNKL